MIKATHALAAAAALLAALPAVLHADTYAYSITTAAANNDPAYQFTASGTLTGNVDPFNSAAIDVTSITSSNPLVGYSFTSVVAPGTTSTQRNGSFDGLTFNNVLYPTSNPLIDQYGFLLYLTSPIGTSLANVVYTPSGYQVDVIDPNDPGAITPFAIDFTVTPQPVPEPSTLALLGTGLAGLAGVIRKRLPR